MHFPVATIVASYWPHKVAIHTTYEYCTWYLPMSIWIIEKKFKIRYSLPLTYFPIVICIEKWSFTIFKEFCKAISDYNQQLLSDMLRERA